jgi:hypothetical protein
MLLPVTPSQMPQSSSTFLPKILHRCLPTGDRISKACATCGCPDEHNEHNILAANSGSQCSVQTFANRVRSWARIQFSQKFCWKDYKRGSMVLNSSLVRPTPPSTALSSCNSQDWLASASSSMEDGQRPGDTYKASISPNIQLHLPV